MLGLGVLAAQVSADDARAARLENGDDAPLPDFGRVAELGYRWQATSRWTMTPGIQWVLHPGASSEVADAAVLGLRVSSE